MGKATDIKVIQGWGTIRITPNS